MVAAYYLKKYLLLFFPKKAPSSYVAGAIPMEPRYGGSPSDLKITHWCHQNGALDQPHSMHMTYQVWEPWSATYMQPQASQ